MDAMPASDIMAEVRGAYATCASYRDTGAVWMNKGPDDASQKPRMTFSTAFVRPDRFRFEFTMMGARRFIVWADSRRVRTRNFIPVAPVAGGKPIAVPWRKPGRMAGPVLRTLGRFLPKLLDLAVRMPGWRGALDMAIAAETGISSGAAHTIPRLLMPERITGLDVTAADDVERLEDEDIEGVPHYRVLTGETQVGSKKRSSARHQTLLWVDQTTFMLRRVEDFWRTHDGRWRDCADYSPEINVDIPEEELRFGPVE